ncbi:hypothetical protein ACIQOV_12520 [Kitasatospora sp. NPDC091257]|uniref:hypothetical protein n=1 Tax=Kitasatospora sp. NPDC091257 TaxID=3364084 RepID=UPI00380FE1E8
MVAQVADEVLAQLAAELERVGAVRRRGQAPHRELRDPVQAVRDEHRRGARECQA